jgi:hypothetical protein
MAEEVSPRQRPATVVAVPQFVRRYREMINEEMEEEERPLMEAPSVSARSPREDYLPNYLYPLLIRKGGILQHELCKDTAVCVIANACGKTAYATSGILEKEYAYADYYRSKRRLFSTSRAIVADRCATGVVSVKQGDGPLIIYLVAHFGPGRALENNEIAMKQLKSSMDRHYVDGLACDGSENRLRNLGECLDSLFNQLQEMNIREILFPVEVEGGSWSHAYIELLQDFAARCMPLKISVSLLCASPLILPEPDIRNKRPRYNEDDAEDGEITCEQRRTSKLPRQLENDH